MKKLRELGRIWGISVLAIVAIWVGFAFYVTKRQEQALDEARVNTSNLARAFEDSLSRTIREIDQTLLYVRALHERDPAQLDLRPWVESADPRNQLVAQIALVDRNGLVTMSNLRPVTRRIDLSDRPHFRHFADHPDDDLFISVPVLGRVSHLWTIQFVRMLKTPAGGFDGIIVLSVKPATLLAFYKSVDLGEHGRVGVIGLDGIIRARAGGPAVFGQPAKGPVLALARANSTGTFAWTDPTDHIRRIVSYRKLPGYPVVLTISMAENELLAPIREQASQELVAPLLLTIFVLLLSFNIARQRRRVIATQRIADLALEHVGVGIMVIGGEGTIEMLNPRAIAILDLPGRIGRGVRYADIAAIQAQRGDFDPSRLPAEVLDAKRHAVRPWVAVPTVYRHTLVSGRVVETRTEVLPDGSAVRSFIDVTAAEKARAEMQEARDAAESAVRARARFLAAMSHEIRTPLNGVLGVTELLKHTSLSAEQLGYAEIIHQAGMHLLQLVTDILDYSKIDQKGVELEEVAFSPRNVIAVTLRIFDHLITARELTVSLDVDDSVPDHLVGDPTRLRQILFNLIGNAIKFTPEGEVRIRLSARQESAEAWRLETIVEDTGIGIPESAVPHLFNEFTQTDGSITRRFGGSGLGLAICRRLIVAMGGDISVRSEPGKGSTFTFHVRLATAHGLESAAERPTALDPAAYIRALAPEILLAEDNRVNRLVAERILQSAGCRVSVVENGEDAVRLAQERRFDAILMDVMMPVMDGLTATRAIRRLPGGAADVPVVGISANAFRSDEAACRDAGMDGFVTKPVDKARLLDELVASLERYRSARARQAIAAGETEPVADQADAGVIPDVPPDVPPDAPGDTIPGTVSEAAAYAAILPTLCEQYGEETAIAVVDAFLHDTPVAIERLRAAAAAGSAGQAAREAHAITGTARSLGIDALAELTKSIEVSARAEGLTPTPLAIENVQRIFEQVARQLDTAVRALRPEAHAA